MTPLPLVDPTIRIDSHLDAAHERGLADDVLDGLTRPFKELPPKHFYDERGCELFDAICELPEYYPTRTERGLLERHADALAAVGGGAAELVELGSGTAAKTRVLLSAMERRGTLRRYVPFDVAESVVRDSAEALVREYGGLRVHGVVGDFERHLGEIPSPREGEPRIVALLGGTIGNFPPGSRRRLLREIGELLGPDDRLLLGTGLVTEVEALEAAYDDSAGVTADFNRNVLAVVNRELEADFPLDGFAHVAFFDRRHEWIEMRLRALRPLSVLVGALDLRVEVAAGEEIRTEISAKFTRARVADDFEAAGLRLDEWFEDDDGRHALSLAARVRD
ncbi:L-histidine N(alpha)-methyltransferase [Conexibacter sp. JD483]|uniref:L-histidine N(alpha)-methyltransferase n=1 Tax=unclassified Conexibacter TaxID=2627773 RepID=UPI0027223538|nr:MULTISPECIES: L-histidine N(alpha)-methyltransferase [unclassified Conexibacter]MDO8188305.1 L-histidine N(alpha)-methyltransferase [Conexibacter sp. CPCC 205706]MDO8198985.1 L-histidine N(alpha)-methyltransferase [Conexibacter sp. CPCC 205762]MDR9372802.1 L-histidine N(alpha)-methyltransferase [Conexibacter sp. JD483]